ncbi:MAG: hypothetical protein SNF33_07180 [Candidatus Algichlamydia australiensis]|nr:hypothetical protein [Chlamydiales bacterium]
MSNSIDRYDVATYALNLGFAAASACEHSRIGNVLSKWRISLLLLGATTYAFNYVQFIRTLSDDLKDQFNPHKSEVDNDFFKFSLAITPIFAAFLLPVACHYLGKRVTHAFPRVQLQAPKGCTAEWLAPSTFHNLVQGFAVSNALLNLAATFGGNAHSRLSTGVLSLLHFGTIPTLASGNLIEATTTRDHSDGKTQFLFSYIFRVKKPTDPLTISESGTVYSYSKVIENFYKNIQQIKLDDSTVECSEKAIPIVVGVNPTITKIVKLITYHLTVAKDLIPEKLKGFSQLTAFVKDTGPFVPNVIKAASIVPL